MDRLGETGAGACARPLLNCPSCVPLAPGRGDRNRYLRMNIDKGNQANGGEDMVVLGNVAHGEVVNREYRIKTLDNMDMPLSVSTDAEGRAWLIVGTDSGFEGLSALYYARISYTLSIVEPPEYRRLQAARLGSSPGGGNRRSPGGSGADGYASTISTVGGSVVPSRRRACFCRGAAPIVCGSAAVASPEPVASDQPSLS